MMLCRKPNEESIHSASQGSPVRDHASDAKAKMFSGNM
jgi:hypothetical protein